MTHHAKIIGGAIVLALSLASVAAPAMAQTTMQNRQNCSIGETYNSGSLSDDHQGHHNGDTGDVCYNIGR